MTTRAKKLLETFKWSTTWGNLNPTIKYKIYHSKEKAYEDVEGSLFVWNGIRFGIRYSKDVKDKGWVVDELSTGLQATKLNGTKKTSFYALYKEAIEDLEKHGVDTVKQAIVDSKESIAKDLAELKNS